MATHRCHVAGKAARRVADEKGRLQHYEHIDGRTVRAFRTFERECAEMGLQMVKRRSVLTVVTVDAHSSQYAT